MANYENNDYLLNKVSKNFVYNSDAGTYEITIEQILKENPNMTIEETIKLKEEYLDILFDIHSKTRKETRLNLQISEENQSAFVDSKEPFDLIIEKIESHKEDYIMYLLIQIIASGELTDIQVRRSILHFFEKLTYSEISKIEGVGYGRIKKSVDKVKYKLKQIINKNQK